MEIQSYLLLPMLMWSNLWRHKNSYQPLGTHTDPKGQHPTLQDVVPELVLWLSFQQDIPLLH